MHYVTEFPSFCARFSLLNQHSITSNWIKESHKSCMLSIDKLRTMNGCLKSIHTELKWKRRRKISLMVVVFPLIFFPLLPALSLGVKGPYTDEEL